MEEKLREFCALSDAEWDDGTCQGDFGEVELDGDRFDVEGASIHPKSLVVKDTSAIPFYRSSPELWADGPDGSITVHGDGSKTIR